MTVHHVQDLFLNQEHEVVFPSLNGTNHLWEAEAMSVPNVVRPPVDSRGAELLVSRQKRRRRLEAVTAMPYQSCETYGNFPPPPSIRPRSFYKMCRTSSRITYSCAYFLAYIPSVAKKILPCISLLQLLATGNNGTGPLPLVLLPRITCSVK